MRHQQAEALKHLTEVHEPLTEVAVKVEAISRKKRVGLLGGSFNPVHNAHLLMIDQVFHQLGLDEVYVMPTNIPPHKHEKKTIDSKHRVRMLELATQDYPYIGIETIELDRQNKSYTFDTMRELLERHPNTEYYFIIGGDMVADLPNWYHIDQLINMVKFVGVKRPNYQAESHYPIIWVDVPQQDISSTLIRQNTKTGCSVNFMLPQAVIAYIEKEGLYVDEL